MNKPNFQLMSRKELHSYFVSHRDDRDAFYAYVDRLHQEGKWIEMPAVESVEDLEKYPNFTSRFQDGAESKDI